MHGKDNKTIITLHQQSKENNLLKSLSKLFDIKPLMTALGYAMQLGWGIGSYMRRPSSLGAKTFKINQTPLPYWQTHNKTLKKGNTCGCHVLRLSCIIQ